MPLPRALPPLKPLTVPKAAQHVAHEGDLSPSPVDTIDDDLEQELYARHVEVDTLAELVGKENQRGTPIPALYNIFYKFVQNPSTVSLETYKRMIDTDDTVGSGVDFLVSCLAARLGRYQHPNKDITDFVNKSLEQIEGGWTNVCKEVLSAAWAGLSVSEKVWANKPSGFVPEKIVTLPPSTILFETHRTGEITDDGILQYQRNYNPFLMTSAGLGFFSGLSLGGSGFTTPFQPDIAARFGDLPYPMRAANSYNYLSIRIPKRKCIHYAFDAQGKFGSPYGRSLLRRCYKWWVMKDAFAKMLAIALDRKGTPLLVVYANGRVTVIDETKAGTGNAKGQHGMGKLASHAAAEAFNNVHNDSVIVLPGKKGEVFDHEVVQVEANHEVFISAINLCNASIMRALLIPSLIFTNGDGTGSYALGQEHAKTFDKILDSWLSGFKAVMLEQLIKELIAYNFPREAWQEAGLGDFAKRELTQDERQKEAELFGVAIDKGVVDTNDINDLNKMRDTLGFEARTTPIPKPLSIVPPFGGFPGGDENAPADDETDPADPQLPGGAERPPKRGPPAASGRVAARGSKPARLSAAAAARAAGAKAKGKNARRAAAKPRKLPRRNAAR